VIAHQRLGGEHVPDFMMAEKSSVGFVWTAVECESPKAKLFTKKGDPSAALNYALKQIEDWREWLKDNRAHAARPRGAGRKPGTGSVTLSPMLSD
jgi:hypothetical protein